MSSQLLSHLCDLVYSSEPMQLKEILDSQKVEKSILNELLLRTVKAHTLSKDLKESIVVLLNHGARINCSDEIGKTPLMIAAEKGYIELVEILLSMSADVNQTDSHNRTALYYAIDNLNNAENADIVGMLVEKTDEKTINSFTSEGLSCLFKACEKGFVDSVKILLEKANPNAFSGKSSNHPLHAAIRRRDFEIMRLLLDSNADVTVKNADGVSAREIIEKDREMNERFKEFLMKPRNSIDFNQENGAESLKPKPPANNQNKFLTFEDDSLVAKRKSFSKNYSLENMDLGPENYGSQPNFNKSLTTNNFQFSPQNGAIFKGPVSQKGKKNYYDEGIKPNNLEHDLIKELTNNNTQNIINNFNPTYQPSPQISKNAVSPSSLQSKANSRFLNSQNMGSRPGFQTSQTSPKQLMSPQNFPAQTNRNNTPLGANSKTPIENQQKSVIINLDMNQTYIPEKMAKTADLLLEAKKRKELMEELEVEKKKNEEITQENKELKLRLRRKEEECETLSRDLEKAQRQSHKLCDASINTEKATICSLDFSDCLNLKNFSKLSKMRTLYQNAVSIVGPSSIALDARLNEEILAFQREVEKFHIENHSLFERLIALVRESIISAISDCTIQTYGSFATELCLPYSDIDLVIDTTQRYNSNYGMILAKIQEALQKSGLISDAKLISGASVPVLKVTCSEEFMKKKLDITIKDNKHNGLNCVNLVKKYLERFKQLKPLVLVLKYMMYSLDLSDTYQGGLNSYGLILMIVSMLQTFESRLILSSMNLGDLLIRFFYLYGWEIDYRIHMINPNDQEKIEKPSLDYKEKNYPQSFEPPIFGPTMQILDKLVILDPTNPNNNVGRCTFKINQIKKAFFIAYVTLHQNLCVESDRIHLGENTEHCCILKKVFFMQHAYLKWMANNYTG